ADISGSSSRGHGFPAFPAYDWPGRSGPPSRRRHSHQPTKGALMTTLSRSFLCAVVASGLLAVAASLSPDWFRKAGLDFWSLPALHAEIARTRASDAELEAELFRIEARMKEKEETVLAVIDGRLSLREAAAKFAAVNAQSPSALRGMLASMPGRTEEERQRRQVIYWVEGAGALKHPRAGREPIPAPLPPPFPA